MVRKVALRVGLTSLFVWSSAAAMAEDRPVNIDDPAQVSAGQVLFNRNCAGYCHGRDGLQARGPSLRGRDDLGGEQIHATIANGKRDAGKFMPAWKGQLDDQQIWQITAFILSLRNEQ
jgi:mono/diheme cytochrome c family protein